MQGELYLHGLSVLDQNGPQLSIELEEDLPLSRPVQVSYGQGFDVQRLAPLQLHLKLLCNFGSLKEEAGVEAIQGTEGSSEVLEAGKDVGVDGC